MSKSRSTLCSLAVLGWLDATACSPGNAEVSPAAAAVVAETAPQAEAPAAVPPDDRVADSANDPEPVVPSEHPPLEHQPEPERPSLDREPPPPEAERFTGCYSVDGTCPPPTPCGPGIRGPGCLDPSAIAPAPAALPPPEPERPRRSDRPTRRRTHDDRPLAAKLTVTQIKEGIFAVKARAEACGPKHGAMPGYKVKVKLSIAGATGRVTKATAMHPDAGTALGKCTARALGQARFARFTMPQMGFVYAIRF